MYIAKERIVSDYKDSALRPAARGWFAVLRLATGFIFLWAFIDKTFGLSFSTPAANAWIRGGAPAGGFLTHLEGGPFKGFFASLATPLVDWLFMLGMLGIGVAVMLGIGLRISAVVGSAIMLMMYFAELPMAYPQSTNPLVDYHIIYALALIVCAYVYAGDTFGLGKAWRSLDLVKKAPWLI